MKKRIVIVDDNIDIRYTIAEICKLEDWTVLTFENYGEVELFLQKGGADLFLVDYHLPEKDGIEIVRMIRKKNFDVPIMILTVEEREYVMADAIKAGADDYALKPIKAIDLISRMKVHLKHYEKARLYTDSIRGINQETLEEIQSVLGNGCGFMEIEEIVQRVEITDKSVYRYLNYMKSHGMVEIQKIYSDKVGRPKTKFKLLQNQIK